MAAHERQLPRREFFKTAVATAAGLTIVPAAAVRGSQANSRLEIGIIGSGGRKARVDVGDCWDHFVVRYAYPNEVLVDFSSAQFTKGYEDLRIRVYGASGTVDSAYEGDVRITGDTPWPGGNTKGLYQSGAIGNIQDFHQAVTGGTALADTLTPSIESNLAAILGRMAAYTGRKVTWDEMMASQERIDPKLQRPKDGPTMTLSAR